MSPIYPRDLQTVIDEMEANALPIQENARLVRELLNRLCSVDADEAEEGVCTDCGAEGPRFTFGESRRPLCGICTRTRQRVAARLAA